jgi:hypothetical protein
MRWILGWLLACQRLFGLTSLEFGGGIGQRCDSIKSLFSTEGRADAAFHYKHVRSLNAEAFARAFLWNVMARGTFNYGWIRSGKLDLQIGIDTGVGGMGGPVAYIFPFPFSTSSVKGHVWDGEGSVGVAIPFGRWTRGEWYLIPEAGYSYFFQKITTGTMSPDSVARDGSPFGVTEIAFSIPGLGPMERRWRGPFIGGDLLWKGWNFTVDLAYAYHYLRMKQKGSELIEIEFFVLPTPGLVQQLVGDVQMSAKLKHLRGQRFSGRVRYDVASFFGLAVSGGYFTTWFKGKRSSFFEDLFSSGQPFATLEGFFGMKGCWHEYDLRFEGIFSF